MTPLFGFYDDLERYASTVDSNFVLNIPYTLLREIFIKWSEEEKKYSSPKVENKDSFGEIKFTEEEWSVLNNKSQGSHNSTNNCDTISQTQISTELKNICKEVILNEPEDATERERGYTIAFKHMLQVIENKESRISKREKALDFLTSQAQKMGLYDI